MSFALAEAISGPIGAAGDRLKAVLCYWSHGLLSAPLTRYGWPLLAILAAGCVASDENSSTEADSTKISTVGPYTAQVVLQPKEQARLVRLELTSESVLEHPRILHIDKQGIF